MPDLSEESFDLHPSFNDTKIQIRANDGRDRTPVSEVAKIQIGANDGRDRIIWWRKYCRQIIFACLLLLVVLFMLGVHFWLLSEEIKKVSNQQSAFLDKLEQKLHNGNKHQSVFLEKNVEVVINSAVESQMEKSEQICKKHHSAILDKLEQNSIIIIGVVTVVGVITVTLIAAVKIWIYSNIRANKGPAATEAIEPKQNNDVDLDNNGGQQQILQMPLEAAVWRQYLSTPIPKGQNFAGNGRGKRRAPSIPNITIDDFGTYLDDEAANRAASPVPALAIPPPAAVITNGGGLNQLKQKRGKGKKKSVDKRHKCNHCQYSTQRLAHMQYHLLIHSGEKPHECKECGERFRQSNHLTYHRATHSRKKPFKCNHCKSTFTMRQSLKRHLRTFH